MEITMENGNNLMEYTSLIKEAENKFESAIEAFVAAADELFTIEGMERPNR